MQRKKLQINERKTCTLKPYDLIAFDLDGTLTDPASGLVKSFSYALTHMDVDYGDPADLTRFIGPPLFSEWQKVYGFTEEQASLALQYFHEYFGKYGWCDNRVYDGVSSMLAALRAEGKIIVLATSKPEHYAKDILDYFDLTQYFDFICGALNERERDKKHEVLSYALDNFLHIPRERCILVGDRKYDAEGAAMCGIDSLGVLYGHGSREEVTACGFTYVVERVEDIVAALI